MNETIKRRLRCAVYTRKSSDEGLDQEYNSIAAQRDAGQAYIASQRHEGWIPVADDYDDPAFSGGNMERPGLRHLLADIEAGKVDVVVVYKIDRLTRSLADFARLVEIFERHRVSFVSVTQQFSTTTSMGRLMLNVLLSFAQFEREVTGERIRDKIAASKRKGLWVGGVPALGYDVVDKKLAVNEQEAALVRRIFQRFVDLGSTTALVRELKLEGVTSKSWTTQDGRDRKGRPLDKSGIYKMFNNRHYLGEMSHKGSWYPGAQPAIVDRKLWDDVHAILAVNGRTRGNNNRARVPFMLKGLIVTPDGRAMTPFAIRKKGRVYRYYYSTRANKEGAEAAPVPRLPAGDIEAAVVEQLRSVLRSAEMLADVVGHAVALDPTLDEAQVSVAMLKLDQIWDNLFPAEQTRIVKLLIEKIVISRTGMEVRLRPTGIESLTRDLSRADEAQEVAA